MKALPTYGPRSVLRRVRAVLIVLAVLPLPGCVAQQADLRQTEKNLQQRIKQSSDESAQTRAQQSQGTSALLDQKIPQLRRDLDLAWAHIQDLKAKVDYLTTRSKKNLSSETDEQGSSFKNVEVRLDSHDELLSSLLVQLAELTKQMKALEKH